MQQNESPAQTAATQLLPQPASLAPLDAQRSPHAAGAEGLAQLLATQFLLQHSVFDVQLEKRGVQLVVPASVRQLPVPEPLLVVHACEQHCELKPQLPETGRQEGAVAQWPVGSQ